MKEKVVLKSTHPEEYPDLVIECRLIPNEKIAEYLEPIDDDKKFYAYKNGVVKVRNGVPGEKVKSVLKTIIDGKEYILQEEEGAVKEREFDGEKHVDIVVTNVNSTSNEQYIVNYKRFMKTYDAEKRGEETVFRPVYDSRLLTPVDENVIIVTAWGSKAICLKGSFIVTYNAAENDYNTIERGAFESTYVVDDQKRNKK